MSNDLYFMPEDIKPMIKGELILSLMEIIEEIRAENEKHLKPLKTDINALDNKLNKLSNKLLYTENDLIGMFDVYEEIIRLSMIIRSRLSQYEIFEQIEIYDKIEYAIYYDGQRYYTDDINLSGKDGSALYARNPKKENIKESDYGISISLEKLVQLIQDQKETAKQKYYRDLFSKHYQSYLRLIKGTYNGTFGSGLNEGHVAEAHEAHLKMHHPDLYKDSRDLSYKGEDFKIKSSIHWTSMENFYRGNEKWSNHETVEDAWKHIRGAKGHQVGTVAGDVGLMQVKSGQKGKNADLTSIVNLRKGLTKYINVLDKRVNPQKAAEELATYLSEKISENGAKILNEKFSNEIDAQEEEVQSGLGLKKLKQDYKVLINI